LEQIEKLNKNNVNFIEKVQKITQNQLKFIPYNCLKMVGYKDDKMIYVITNNHDNEVLPLYSE